MLLGKINFLIRDLSHRFTSKNYGQYWEDRIDKLIVIQLEQQHIQQNKQIKIKIMNRKGLASQYNKKSQQNSTRLIQLQKINNTFSHKNKQESAFTSITTLNNNLQKIQRKLHINDQILNRRKQSYLNTQYNRRLNALRQITKQNKRIYVRINSQKSLYSQQDMRKSSVSIRSSKSSSRISNRSGVNQNNIKKPGLLKKNADAMTIQPQSLNNINNDKIKQFKSVFMITNKPYTHKNQKLLDPTKINSRSFSVKIDSITNKTKPNQNLRMDNILHKIAEQIKQNPIKKFSSNNNKKRILY